MQTKIFISMILIYFGSGLIYGHHIFIGMPLALTGSGLIGYVCNQLDQKGIK